jgi:hypothetical protein
MNGPAGCSSTSEYWDSLSLIQAQARKKRGESAVSNSATTAHEQHARRLLDAVEASDGISQRSLAKDLGIALGLTNLLIKHLVHKGWVRVIHVKPNRVKYLITPAGIVEKARMSRAYFDASVQFYKQTRSRIQERFLALSSSWPADAELTRPKRIVFYGGGEVAEIGYICLVDTDLELVGVVDNNRTKAFFGHRVYPSSSLGSASLNGAVFDRLVVMSFASPEVVTTDLTSVRFPLEQVFWL